MKNFNSLSKAQLVSLLTEIETSLNPVIVEAKEESEKYSTESSSRLAFEVGYLNGRIKNVLQTINLYKGSL